MGLDIKEALSKAEHLPSPPSVATQVLDLAAQDDVDIDEVSEVISRDPALTTKLLKVANSALFATAHPVSTVRQAVMVLGMRTVKIMVLGFSLVQTDGREDEDFDYQAFWRTSLTAAVAGRVFAQHFDRRLRDEAFVAGLLQDIGVLAAKEAWPRKYQSILERRGQDGASMHELETEILGVDHQAIGAYLLRSWGIPEQICHAVENHHRADAVGESHTEVQVRLVRIAELASIVAHNFHRPDFDPDSPEFITGIAELRDRLSRWFSCAEENQISALLDEICKNVSEMSGTFDLGKTDRTQLAAIQAAASQLMVQLSLGMSVDVVEAQRRAAVAEVRATELEGHNRELTELATTDSLTGLTNRMNLDRRIRADVNRAREEGLSIGVFMMDLDKFKSLNDTYGHAAGDEVLRQVGKTLLPRCRSGEILARYGGEEFCVVMAGIPYETFIQRGEELRKAIENLAVHLDDGTVLHPTVSIGGSWAEGEIPTAKELQSRADALLYRSKEQGRNRVTVERAKPARVQV